MSVRQNDSSDDCHHRSNENRDVSSVVVEPGSVGTTSPASTALTPHHPHHLSSAESSESKRKQQAIAQPSNHDGSAPPLEDANSNAAPFLTTTLSAVADRLKDGLELARMMRLCVQRISVSCPMEAPAIHAICDALEDALSTSMASLRTEHSAAGADGGGSGGGTRLGLLPFTPIPVDHVDVRTLSSVSSSLRTQAVTQVVASVEHVGDATTAAWLNETFAQSKRRRRSRAPSTGSSATPLPTQAAATSVNSSDSQHLADSATPKLLPQHQADGAPTTTLVGDQDTPKTPTLPVEKSSTPPPPPPPPLALSQLPAAEHQGASVPSDVSSPPPAASAPKVDAVKSVAIDRSNVRSVPAEANLVAVATLLKKHKIPFLADVDSPDFDIFRTLDVHGPENLLVIVAANVFARYTFVSTLHLSVKRLLAFVRRIRKFYRDENFYHNHLHAADVLQTTHIFLLVNDMREHFSDVELLSVLFAALIHDVGHLGVSNVFLSRIRHPLSRVFNDQSTLESAHAAVGMWLLETEGCNFFRRDDDNDDDNGGEEHNRNNDDNERHPQSSATTECNEDLDSLSNGISREAFEDFRSLVVNFLLGTDMKVHAEHGKLIQGILSDGVIVDSEIPILLRSILHVADIANPLKPFPIYLRWVERVLAEFWTQGDEERRRGLPISLLCDRNTTTSVGKPQAGFINFVVRPFLSEMTEVLPRVWMERMNDNAARMAAMSPEQEDEILNHIRHLTEGYRWTDPCLPASSSPFTLTYALRRMTTTMTTGAVGNEHPRNFPQIAFPLKNSDEGDERETHEPPSEVQAQPHAAHSSAVLVPTSPVTGEHECNTGLPHPYRRTGGIAAWRSERKHFSSARDDKLRQPGDDRRCGSEVAGEAAAPGGNGSASARGGTYISTAAAAAVASPVLGLREVVPPPQWLLGVTGSPIAPVPPSPRQYRATH